MARSGSINFNMNRDELIKQSLKACGALTENQTPSAAQMKDAANALNMIIKEWQTDGLQLWLIQAITVTLTAAKASYTIGAGGDVNVDRPTKIYEAFIRDGTNDTPLTPVSRQEYWSLGDKTQTGTPNSFYYEPQLDLGVLYLYVVPDTNAATKTIELKAHRQIQDMDAATDSFDFPMEWFRALKFALAADLGIDYATPERHMRRLEKYAAMAFDKVSGWDVEQASVSFMPETRGR